jgi:hypothetical protein
VKILQRKNTAANMPFTQTSRLAAGKFFNLCGRDLHALYCAGGSGIWHNPFISLPATVPMPLLPHLPGDA